MMLEELQGTSARPDRVGIERGGSEIHISHTQSTHIPERGKVVMATSCTGQGSPLLCRLE